MSIKQKIHSFETFSSPGPEERRSSIRRPTASSISVPLMEEKSAGLCSFSSGSDVDHEKIQQKIPEEMKSDQSTCEAERNHGGDSVQTSGNISATLGDCHQSKTSENQPHLNESSTRAELSACDTMDSPNMEKDAAHQSLLHHNTNVSTSKQESEPKKVDLSELKECNLPSATTSRTSENDAKICSDEEVEKTPGEPLKTSQSPAPPTDNQGLKSREGEQFEKMIAFSNQVSC